MLKVWKSYMKSMTKLRVIKGQGYRVQAQLQKMWQRYLEYFFIKDPADNAEGPAPIFCNFYLEDGGRLQLFSSFQSHTTWAPYTLENSFFALKTHQVFFCPHYAGEIWKRNNYRSVWISSGRELTWLSWWHRFRAASYSNVFRPHWNAKPAFLNFSGLKSSLFVTDSCRR